MTITKIAVVDIETTHLKSEYGTIVEMGICKLDLTDGSIQKLLDTVVREPDFNKDVDVNAWVFKNTSLTVEDVLSAPEWEFVKPKISHIFSIYPITAFNQQFDLMWLKDRRVKIERVVPDPMKEATNILQIPHPNPTLSKYKLPSVSECWNYYFPNIYYQIKHRAYDDCLHEACIIYEMYRKKQYLI